MKEEVIQFVGVKDLTEAEQKVVNNLSTEYFQKIKRCLDNMLSLVVHIKCYKSGGKDNPEKKKKFSVHIKCTAPGKIYESDKKSHGWDLAQSLHKGFEALENQIHHSLHNDTSRTKNYE